MLIVATVVVNVVVVVTALVVVVPPVQVYSGHGHPAGHPDWHGQTCIFC